MNIVGSADEAAVIDPSESAAVYSELAHRQNFVRIVQQRYVGAALTYAVSPHWSLTMAVFGLSAVSDPFFLRMGLSTSIENAAHRLAHGF